MVDLRILHYLLGQHQSQNETTELILFNYITHCFIMIDFYGVTTEFSDKFCKAEFEKNYSQVKHKMKVQSIGCFMKIISFIIKFVLPSAEALQEPEYDMVNQSLMDISRYVVDDRSFMNFSRIEERPLTENVLTPEIMQQSQYSIVKNNSPCRRNTVQLIKVNDKKMNLIQLENHPMKRNSVRDMKKILVELDKEDEKVTKIKKETSLKQIKNNKFIDNSKIQNDNSVDYLFKKLSEQRKKLLNMQQK